MKPEKVKFMLMAANMKRAVAFYRDVIGLDEIFVSDFWTELRFGDAITDGLAALGDVTSVRHAFVGFQPALYAG